MKIFSIPVRLAVLISLSMVLSGCGSNWLVGKWTLDHERTLATITAETEKDDDGKGLFKDLVVGLQKGISRVMLAQFEGVTLEFTSKELRTIRNGVGEAKTYEIIEKPAVDTYVVQYEDGEIVTWINAEEGIAMKLTGNQENWVHFSPLE